MIEPREYDSKQEQSSETIEKKFYEINTEFSPDLIKTFREELLMANPEMTKNIIDSRIALLEKQSDKIKDIVPSSPNSDQSLYHRGYISSETAVHFQGGAGVTIGSKFKLKNTEYLHEAITNIQGNKEKIKNGGDLFNQVESFLNSYFGIPEVGGEDKRADLIAQKAGFNLIFSDDEYWAAVNNVDISIFKDEHTAQCSERSAMAQNILSLFGYETYYFNGNVSVDGKQEGHAFNVVSSDSSNKNIVDFSITSSMEYRGTTWLSPTIFNVGDFDMFMNGNRVQSKTYKNIINEDGTVSHIPQNNLVYNVTTYKK